MGTNKSLAFSAATTGATPKAPTPPDEGETSTGQKATLSLFDSAPAGSGGKPGQKRGSIEFQFNPKEVSIQKAAKWERKPAKGSATASPPEFTGTDPCKLTVEMFFDSTDTADGSVVSAVESLFACCVPTDESLSQKKPSPPLVVLQWGTVSSFPAFVTAVSAKYTLFRADGTPIRALCSVSMEEMPGDPLGQNPTSGSRAVRRVHRLVSGDTLSSVAFAEYGDPTQWRALAAFNEIDDPMRLPTGAVLMLPSPDELATRR